MSDPVVIPANPGVPATWAALRIVAVMAGSVAAGLGIAKQETVQAVLHAADVMVPAAGALIAGALGIWRTFHSAAKAKVAADAAPSDKAITK